MNTFASKKHLDSPLKLHRNTATQTRSAFGHVFSHATFNFPPQFLRQVTASLTRHIEQPHTRTYSRKRPFSLNKSSGPSSSRTRQSTGSLARVYKSACRKLRYLALARYSPRTGVARRRGVRRRRGNTRTPLHHAKTRAGPPGKVAGLA